MANKKKGAFRAVWLLVAICVAAAVFCAYKIISELYTREQGRSYYAALFPVAETAPVAAESSEPSAAVSVDAVSGEEASDTEPPAVPYLDFEALGTAIPGLVAWIRCEGTVIDYPVVQGSDNDYYLNRLPDGTYNKMGSIFLDYRSTSDFSGGNSIIYGHHMSSGDMFSALEKYMDQAFYDLHPTIEIYTPEGGYKVELIAGYVVDATKETLPLEFKDAEGLERYITEIQARSTFVSGVTADEETRLITLCTCTYGSSNARFILVGKLIEA